MKRLLCVLGVVAAAGAAGCGAVEHTALQGVENCINGVDDNGDGRADCDDPQCLAHAACLDMREMNCVNGVDDDDDTLVDCNDPDCQQTPECGATREWSCHDGVDNDGDGFVDCDDPDCQEACTEVCNDGTDNDGDLLVDCADPDCVGAEGCPGGNEVCGNQIDDDGDGLVDCDDPDCAGRPMCAVVEICNNEIDDDGDTLNNCDDPDCDLSPYCREMDCLDGQDNDEDGDVDCDDADCSVASACLSGTECLPASPLTCGQNLESTTEGRLNNFGSYSCHPGTFDGPERYFQFTATREQFLDIYLTDWDLNGLTMFVTAGDPNGGCEISNGCETEYAPGDNYLPLVISAGTTLFLIVDGPAGTPGPFDLWMDCTPTDEVGLCDDGLNNDFFSDGDADCWDEDCLGDPVCDYWVSAGFLCYGDLDCAPGEFCDNLTFNGTSTDVAFCTRDCSFPGTLGGECATDTYGDGVCSAAQSSDGPRCLLPCAHPTDPCPAGSTCTDIVSGSTTNLMNGYCLPYQ